MAAKLLDGAAMALEVEKELKQRVEALRERGVVPGLCVILVGSDPASQTYVANKEKACARLGIHSRTVRMGEETTQAELEAEIEKANHDESIHGILVQLPLPAGLDEHRALALIRPEKDVDGFHAVNMGRLARGEDCVVACTPKGALHMLKAAATSLESPWRCCCFRKTPPSPSATAARKIWRSTHAGRIFWWRRWASPGS